MKAPSLHHGQISRIQHGGDALFDGIEEYFDMVQYNSLVVEGSRLERPTLPKELEIIGWCQDGTQESIMALKHVSQPLWGVQFHPEVSRIKS